MIFAASEEEELLEWFTRLENASKRSEYIYYSLCIYNIQVLELLVLTLWFVPMPLFVSVNLAMQCTVYECTCIMYQMCFMYNV